MGVVWVGSWAAINENHHNVIYDWLFQNNVKRCE